MTPSSGAPNAGLSRVRSFRCVRNCVLAVFFLVATPTTVTRHCSLVDLCQPCTEGSETCTPTELKCPNDPSPSAGVVGAEATGRLLQPRGVLRLGDVPQGFHRASEGVSGSPGRGGRAAQPDEGERSVGAICLILVVCFFAWCFRLRLYLRVVMPRESKRPRIRGLYFHRPQKTFVLTRAWFGMPPGPE